MPAPPLFPAVPVFNFQLIISDAASGPAKSNLFQQGQNLVTNLKSQVFSASFEAVEGLNVELEVETYREGGSNPNPRRFKTRAQYEKLVFKRGVTPNPDLWDWAWQV